MVVKLKYIQGNYKDRPWRSFKVFWKTHNLFIEVFGYLWQNLHRFQKFIRIDSCCRFLLFISWKRNWGVTDCPITKREIIWWIRWPYRQTALLLEFAAAQTLPSGPAGNAGTGSAWEGKRAASPTLPPTLLAAATEKANMKLVEFNSNVLEALCHADCVSPVRS